MDKALKQRLVGASVLIILAVIVLPMLLSGRSDTLKQESRQIKLPPKPEELSIQKRRFPVGVLNKAANDQKENNGEDVQAQAAGVDDVPANTDAPDSPGDQGQRQLVVKTPSSSDKPGSPVVNSITLKSDADKTINITGRTDDAPQSLRYLVQVASFSSEKNANVLAGRLRAENLPVLMDVVERTAGRLHRVRVGPYAARDEADSIVARLRSRIKDVIPRVLDLRPGESSPVSMPSDPLVRWVVQVGSFSQSKSAEALVAELQNAGMAAFSEKVSSHNGVAYKVQIGPELDRSKAVAQVRDIKAKYPDAFVTTRE